MNKTAIKNYAVWARVQLIEAVKQRAYEYEITADGENDGELEAIGGKPLSIEEINQRRRLVAQIDQKGYEQVMEEAAYTWFNRFIALRFMEVNGYLPSKIRVFTDENGAFKPEILSEAMTVELDGLDREVVFDLLDRQDNEALYKYLLITQCNALHEGLPYMFEKIANWTELLFPANLLRSDSVIARMVADIPEPDWTDQVQIIGWLYQYYNTELNERVYDGNMSKSRIAKELLPAATTIYTPDWVVHYMVENSLGRLWYEGHSDYDKSQWKYYLDEAEQEPEVEAQLAKIRAEYRGLNPQDIKLIDPCMGSGHILVYAFDVLMQIYAAAGWNERDAAQSILEHNLYGLDIDDRAAQLAYFAVMMKARQYDRRIFTRGIQPHVYAIGESNGLDSGDVDYFVNNDPKLQKDFATLREQLRDAKEYGSILNISPVDFAALHARVDEVREECSMFQEPILNSILPLIQVAEVMAQKYDVVVTNPPYLGSSRFSAKLNDYVVANYADVKSDLSMVMYKHALQTMCKRNGFVSFITTTSWMFLSSFEKLRTYVLSGHDFISLVDFGTELFEGKVGHNPIVAWVNRRSHTDYAMTGIRLVDYCYSRRDEKEPEFFSKKNYYYPKASNFSKIPGSPVAYWLAHSIFEIYADGMTMESVAHPKVGMQTSNNDKYLRLWFEVNYSEFNGSSMGKKWIKYLKGGSYRKWYGNLEYLLFYNGCADFILQQKNARVLDDAFLYKKKCTWTDLTSGNNSFRMSPDDTFYDISGHCFFPEEKDQLWLLAYANTGFFSMMKQVFNSTFHCQVGDVAKIVVPRLNSQEESAVTEISQENVSASKCDWDSYETSWDFKRNPLV